MFQTSIKTMFYLLVNSLQVCWRGFETKFNVSFSFASNCFRSHASLFLVAWFRNSTIKYWHEFIKLTLFSRIFAQ